MMPFPISEQSPIAFAGPLPAETDVVVIGGGVIGVCTALYLARKGRRVVLLEKGRIAGEQSSRNRGAIRTNFPSWWRRTDSGPSLPARPMWISG
jgi:glycine/D-amino acid oxidase-like deaminating enzyme